MAAKSDKSFLAKVEEEIAKGGKNVQLTADVVKDYTVDKAIQLAPQAAATTVGLMEQGRSFLQQGSVPNAAAKLARAKTDTKAVNKFFSGLRNAAPVQAAIELAKGSYLIGKEGARKGHAESGKQLIKEPLAYQAANLYVSPADALSKYGALREALGKKAFEERYVNPLNRQIAAEEERKRSDVPPVEIRKALQPNPRKFFK